MDRHFRLAPAVLLLSVLGGGFLSAQEPGDSAFTEERVSFYGYALNYTNLNIDPQDLATDLGDILYLRLKGDFRPQDTLAFHLEAAYSARTGNQNPYVVMQTYGLAPAGSPSSLQDLVIDHAWGVVSFGAFDLQFGKLPLGWGTGYVFNPTQRAAASGFIDPVVEETPGTLALLPTWPVSDALTLSGYLAFQDRSHRDTIDLRDGAWENLPFGLKAQGFVGSFDLSASVIKEVLYRPGPPGTYRRSWLLGTDAAGAVWNFGVYAEAVLRLPTDEAGRSWEADRFSVKEDLELAVGGDYSFSDIELVARLEYYHQGPGETETALYDVLKVLSGECTVQGEDYLFGYLEKTLSDYSTLSAGCLVNLHDGSLAVLPELAYDAYDNLQVKLGAAVFLGPGGSEFNGEYDLPAGRIDITPLSVHASVKLSF